MTLNIEIWRTLVGLATGLAYSKKSGVELSVKWSGQFNFANVDSKCTSVSRASARLINPFCIFNHHSLNCQIKRNKQNGILMKIQSLRYSTRDEYGGCVGRTKWGFVGSNPAPLMDVTSVKWTEKMTWREEKLWWKDADVTCAQIDGTTTTKEITFALSHCRLKWTNNKQMLKVFHSSRLFQQKGLWFYRDT